MKKDNKWLILIILILIFVVGIGIGIVLRPKGNRQVFYKKGSIVVERERVHEEICINCGYRDYYKYYLNNIYMPNWSNGSLDDDVKVEAVIDNRYVIIILYGSENDIYNIYDKTGKIVNLGVSDIKEIKYNQQNSELIITTEKFIADYEAKLCADYEDNDIVRIKYKVKYVNHSFDNLLQAIESKKVSEIIQDKYGMTCAELKKTNDPNLEYEKSLASGREIIYKNGSVIVEAERTWSENDPNDIGGDELIYYKYYVNNKHISAWSKNYYYNKITIKNLIDNKYLLIALPGVGDYSYDVYDLNGNLVNLGVDYGFYGYLDAKYDEQKSELTFTVTNYRGDYEAQLCAHHSDNDLAWADYKIKYINHAFAKPEIMVSETVNKVVYKRYGMTCAELKKTNNPNLEYEKRLANGE